VIRCITSKKGLVITLPGRRTACPSAAARAPYEPSKCQRSRARSGRLHGRVRRSGRQLSGCLPHGPTTPAQYHTLHAGRQSEPRPSGITRGTPGLHLNHAHRESRRPSRARRTTGVHTTPCITGTPHHGLSYHAGTTGLGTTEVAQRAFRKRNSAHLHQNGMLITRPGRRTVRVQPPACALANATDIGTGRDSKTQKAPILRRASGSAATRCWAAIAV